MSWVSGLSSVPAGLGMRVPRERRMWSGTSAMCRQLEELRQAILAYAGGFDPGLLSPAGAGGVVRVCAQMEASLSSVKALAAARAAEGEAWKTAGWRSAAEHLDQQTGTSPAAAKRTLATGERLAGQPEVAAAARAGRLSAAQAEAVADGVAANPAKAAELIDKAGHASLAELNEEVARAKAAVTDLEARRRAVHARRALRRWTDRDGAFQAHLYGHPQDGARLWGILDPIRRRLNMLRRPSAPPQPLDALDYDALMTMAAIAAGQDGELGVGDLLELGLFPQLHAAALVGASTGADPPEAPPAAPSPAPTAWGTQLVAPAQPGPARVDAPDLFSAVGQAGPAAPPAGPPAARLAAPPAGPPAAGPVSRPQGRRVKKLAGSPARIMVRVDLDSLLRGVVVEGELCEIVGYGPVPV
jgi:hypothetical protein